MPIEDPNNQRIERTKPCHFQKLDEWTNYWTNCIIWSFKSIK